MVSKRPLVSIVITHYKAKKEILSCIASIKKFRPKVSYEIIVVDNDEEHPIQNELLEAFPLVRYLKAPYNLGFGPGNNFGAKSARGDILLFLNADTIFLNNVIDALVTFLKNHSKAGVISPILFNKQNKPYPLQGTDILTPSRGVVVLSFLNKVFPKNKISKTYWKADWKKNELREIPVVPGTAMAIRKKVFTKIGGFDEKFFIYFEEHDMGKRLIETGYTNYILPTAKLYHEWGASTTDKKVFNKHFANSRFYYFRKHYGLPAAFLVTFFAHLGKSSISRFTVLMSVLLITGILIFYHTRGFIPYDEGWFIYAGSRLFHGEVPYKDFQYLYFPGSLYINSLGFLLFGESILASRVMAMLISVFAAVVLYLFGKRLQLPGYVILLSILTYLFWGPAHINFIWPVMIVIPTGLFACYLFFHGIHENDTIRMRLLFIAGLMVGITLLLKQNFGLALLLNTGLVILFIKQYRNIRSMIVTAAGFAVVWIIQFVYLIHTGSLDIFLDEMYYFMFDKILRQGMLASPYPWEYPSPLPYQVVKMGLYLSPLFIGILALGMSLKQKRPVFFFATLCILYYLLSIRPTTDYIHLTPLIAMTTISVLVIFSLLHSVRLKKVLVLFVLGCMLFGMYSSLFLQYYRWEAPLSTNTSLLTHPRALIYSDPETVMNVRKVTTYITENSPEGGSIFIYGLSPMYYFLTQRQNPTRYDYVHTGVQTSHSVEEIVNTFRKHPQMLIMSDAMPVPKNSRIDRYIMENYEIVYQVDKYYFFKHESFLSAGKKE